MNHILVLGLGISGKSALKYLSEQGKRVVGVDKNASKLKLEPFFQNYTLLGEEEVHLSNFDCLVKSPGIPWEHPLVKEALDLGISVTSEMELALNVLQNKGKKLFAITGSNGKTTTTLLTTHILNVCGKKALACGNVGIPLLSEVNSDIDFFVVELSSFQLETLESKVFDAGCILNITPNHLDRYVNFDAYAKTKFRLQHCLKPEGKLFLSERGCREFNHFIDPANKEKVATIFPLSYRGGEIVIAAHDLENLSFAKALTSLAHVKSEEFWEAFSSFIKPPHRIEFVREHQGVRYVNDSKATSCDAVIKALEAMDRPVILIAGGLDKKGDFQSWIKIFREKVKKVLLIGKDAAKIEAELQDVVECELTETLSRALLRAQSLANPGECVLFSPGCASYDQFRNYEHRGDVFKQLVNELGEKKL